MSAYNATSSARKQRRSDVFKGPVVQPDVMIVGEIRLPVDKVLWGVHSTP
jgi:hypothetical protein